MAKFWSCVAYICQTPCVSKFGTSRGYWSCHGMFCGSRLEFNSGMHGSPFYCETGSIPISTVILVQEKSIPIATSSQKSDAPRLPGGAFNRTHTCYTVTDRKIIKYYNIFHLNYPPACYCRPAAGKASFHFFTQPNAIVSQQ